MRKILSFAGFFICINTLAIQALALDSYIDDQCMVPLVVQEGLAAWEARCMPVLSNDQVEEVKIPMHVRNWGSQGLAGASWRFKDQDCNNFFSALQRQISLSLPVIRESPHDLFHAHLISYGDEQDKLVAVYHAKEYPFDFEPIKNYYQVASEMFNSTDKSFGLRNIIYSSERNSLYIVYNINSCRNLFSEQSVNTLSEHKVSLVLSKAKLIGDVNVFMANTIDRIMYNNYQSRWGTERRDTGKSLVKRMNINLEISHWIKGLEEQRVIYFLTGINP